MFYDAHVMSLMLSLSLFLALPHAFQKFLPILVSFILSCDAQVLA